MVEETLYNELVRQAPGLAALILVVVVFLKAMAARDAQFLQGQKDRDVLFLQAQKDRDALFLASQEMRDKAWLASVGTLSSRVGENTKIITSHDSAMKVTAENLLREKKKTDRKS